MSRSVSTSRRGWLRRPPPALGSRGVGVAAGLVALVGLWSCHHVGSYVWVDGYKDAAPVQSAAYVIAPGDVISVRVWNQDSMSGRVRVRHDGMISLPFVNDVEAAGVPPAALARRMEGKLKDFVVTPIVTVSLEEPVAQEVSVLGEVARPGVYQVDRAASVLKAIAAAGGLTESAGRDRIFVLRSERSDTSAAPTRIRFTYQALTHAEGAAARFRLRSGDVVVVE